MIIEEGLWGLKKWTKGRKERTKIGNGGRGNQNTAILSHTQKLDLNAYTHVEMILKQEGVSEEVRKAESGGIGKHGVNISKVQWCRIWKCNKECYYFVHCQNKWIEARSVSKAFVPQGICFLLLRPYVLYLSISVSNIDLCLIPYSSSPPIRPSFFELLVKLADNACLLPSNSHQAIGLNNTPWHLALISC